MLPRASITPAQMMHHDSIQDGWIYLSIHKSSRLNEHCEVHVRLISLHSPIIDVSLLFHLIGHQPTSLYTTTTLFVAIRLAYCIVHTYIHTYANYHTRCAVPSPHLVALPHIHLTAQRHSHGLDARHKRDNAHCRCWHRLSPTWWGINSRKALGSVGAEAICFERNSLRPIQY